MLRSSFLRYALSIVKQHQRYSSSSIPTPALNSDKVSEESPGIIENKPKENVTKEGEGKEKGRSDLVKTAFAHLKHNQLQAKGKSNIEEKIKAAITPEDLLSISDYSYLNRVQALKIVSTLSEWSLSGKVKDSSFESDPRFKTLCKIVGNKDINPKYSSADLKSGDLSVVLGVAGEDEAAKIIDNISLPQMIKILSSLCTKKRRSLPLLRSLAFNIGRKTSKLDVKQSADILYAISSLNFPDEVLLERVCSDLIETVPFCQKSAVFGSICTSLGMLRYKDLELLSVLCNWALKKKDLCRSQDLVSLLLFLASVKHVPDKELLDVFSAVKEEELPSALTWLDVVWSMAVIGFASQSQLSSVLSPKFVDRLSASAVGVAWKRKLLNLNGAAKWTKGYKGPLMNEDFILEATAVRSKEKQQLVTSLLDSLSNLFPSSNYFKSSVDVGMGFLIDAECLVDAKMNPSPLFDKKTGQPIEDKSSKKNRIAFFIHDYHSCTKGRIEIAGQAHFNTYLASLLGYKVINIMYTDYSVGAKLVQRVQYIEGLLREAVAEAN